MMLEDLRHGVFGLAYGYAVSQGLSGEYHDLEYSWKNATVESNATIGARMSAVINNSNHAIVENGQTLISNLEEPNTFNYTIPLFCLRDYTGTYGYILKGSTRIYKWIRTNRATNTVVENLVPCYREDDNVAGMFDLVSGAFITNSGSGTFIVGEEV